MNNTDQQYTDKFLSILQGSDPDAMKVIMQTVDALYNYQEAGTSADERPDKVICIKDFVR